MDTTSKLNTASLEKYSRLQEKYHQLTPDQIIFPSPTDNHKSTRYTIPNKGANSQTIYNQHQDLYKVRKMTIIIKGKIDQKQKSQASWLVTKIKNPIGKEIK